MPPRHRAEDKPKPKPEPEPKPEPPSIPWPPLNPIGPFSLPARPVGMDDATQIIWPNAAGLTTRAQDERGNGSGQW